MIPNESTEAVAGADCARYASLLPRAAQAMLDERLLAKVRAHVASCAHCQREIAVYERLDDALRRVLNAKAKDRPLFSRDEIVGMRARAEGEAAAGGAPVGSGRSPRHAKSGLFIGIPAIAAVLLLALFAGFVFHVGGGRGGIVSNPKHAALPSNIDLYSISMVSATEGWAVGATIPDPNYSPVQNGTPKPNYRDPVLAHYHDGMWSMVALPAPMPTLSSHGLSIVLYSVSMVSADEGWAVGGSVLPQGRGWVVDGMTIGMLLHYARGTWTLAAGGTSDTPVFTQVRMRSATDGWAFAGATIYHYDGSAWRQVKDAALNHMSIDTLAFTPDGGVWAEGVNYGFSGGSGIDGADPSVFLHFDGSRWMRVASPLPRARIASIAMMSASEGWAVGVLPPPTKGDGSGEATVPYEALILHYHDGRWEEQARYPGLMEASGTAFYTFNRIAAMADGQGWAIGSDGLLAHYAHGSWERLPRVASATLYDVAFVSASEGWAVGERGTVLHYANGVWKVYGA